MQCITLLEQCQLCYIALPTVKMCDKKVITSAITFWCLSSIMSTLRKPRAFELFSFSFWKTNRGCFQYPSFFKRFILNTYESPQGKNYSEFCPWGLSQNTNIHFENRKKVATKIFFSLFIFQSENENCSNAQGFRITHVKRTETGVVQTQRYLPDKVYFFQVRHMQ